MHRIRSVTGFATPALTFQKLLKQPNVSVGVTNPDRKKMSFFYMMGMQIKEEANLGILIQAIIEVEKKLAPAPIKNDSKQKQLPI